MVQWLSASILYLFMTHRIGRIQYRSIFKFFQRLTRQNTPETYPFDLKYEESCAKLVLVSLDCAEGISYSQLRCLQIRHLQHLVTTIQQASPLRRINHQPINIRTSSILPIEQPPNRNRIRPLLKIQQQRRAQNNTLMRIPLIQRRNLFRPVIHNHTRDTTQLPRTPVDTVRRTGRLIAKAHVICILVVERYPLRFALSLDSRKTDFAVVSVDASDNHAVAAKVGFLFEGIARGRCILAVICCSRNRRDFSCFDVQIVDIVPFQT